MPANACIYAQRIPLSTLSPHLIVPRLMDGAISRIREARDANLNRHDAQFQLSMDKSCVLIDGLKNTLDWTEGVEVAAHLDDVYSYIQVQLGHARYQEGGMSLDICESILCEVREAWGAVGYEG